LPAPSTPVSGAAAHCLVEAFILAKLREHDAAELKDVLVDLYRDASPDLVDITKFEWQTILAYMGASDEDIKDVCLRMGRG
jgi:hypothetical protein